MAEIGEQGMPKGRKAAAGVRCPNGCDGRLRWLSTWTVSCAECGWFGQPTVDIGRTEPLTE